MDIQSCIQEAIIPELIFDVFIFIIEMPENLLIGQKLYQGSIGLIGFAFFMIFQQDAFLKFSGFLLTVAIGGNPKMLT